MCGASDVACNVRLIGSFAVTAPDGTDLTPKSSKAKALIALVLTRAGRSMSRAQIQDKLWSDRETKQAQDSLRGDIMKIRQAFGPYAGLINDDDRREVAFATDGLTCDYDDLPVVLSRMGGQDELPEFLEGLSIPDPEFDDWVRDKRMMIFDLLHDLRATKQRKRLAPDNVPAVSIISHNDQDSLHATVLQDGVLKNIGEWSTLRIVDDTEGSATWTDFSFECKPLPSRETLCFHMRFCDRQSGELYWNCTRAMDFDAFDDFSEPMAQLRNQLSDQAIFGMLKQSGHDVRRSEVEGFRVACQIFESNGRDYVQIADALSRLAADTPRGIYSAWLAFLTTYAIGERKAADTKAVREEAEAYIRDAIEKEPYHSMVLALCSYVRSFVFHDYFTGHELAKRSINCNLSNPIAWAALGAANFYIGRHAAAREAVLRARAISGGGPYHYLIESLCCISATLAGQLDEAEFHAQLSHQLSPGYTPPLRYLAAIYTRKGQLEKADRVCTKLRLLEPDFSLELMSEAAYPVAALRDSGFFEFSQSRHV